MSRYLLIAGIILVSLITFQLYEVSYNTNDIRKNIKLLKTEILIEKEKINNLKATLSNAKSPKNIAKLNDNLLKLQPQNIEQFVTIDKLPVRIEIETLQSDENFSSINELFNEVIKQN